jgi:hypothetical protein
MPIVSSSGDRVAKVIRVKNLRGVVDHLQQICRMQFSSPQRIRGSDRRPLQDLAECGLIE